MAYPGEVSHHVRKVIKVGRSVAVVIPPHVLDHLAVELGDLLVWDITPKRFAVLSRADVPPYVADPSLFRDGDYPDSSHDQ